MGQLNRVLTTAVAATVAAVVVGAVPAGAAQSSSGANGVGSSTTKTDVLSVSLGSAGSLLQVGILSDRGEASIDPHTGAVGASNTLVPLTVDSKTANIHVAVPGLSTRAPGGASDAGGTALTLEKLGVPRSVATAEINPAALHSDYAPTAARSNMGAAQIRNLTVAGGAVGA